MNAPKADWAGGTPGYTSRVLVIAHAADAIFFAPVLVVITFISISSLRERRRERREAEQGGRAASVEATPNG